MTIHDGPVLMDKRRKLIAGKPRPYIMAHRGNQALYPENTIGAFRRAVDDGADILETDLQVTADGEFVCIHDDTVDRTTDGQGEVSLMRLAQIKTLGIRGGNPEQRSERIPTLAECIAVVPDDLLLALELKSSRFIHGDICHRLAEELEVYGVRDRTLVISFSLTYLRNMLEVAPDIPAGLITLKRLFPWRQFDLSGPFWPLILLNPLYVWLAHRRGQMVCPLDTNPDSRLWLYRMLGCDAILTNDPGATRRALKR